MRSILTLSRRLAKRKLASHANLWTCVITVSFGLYFLFSHSQHKLTAPRPYCETTAAVNNALYDGKYELIEANPVINELAKIAVP